jgi:hypothetical protein
MNVLESVDPRMLDRIAGLRHGFLIADEVLRDTLSDFARGRIEAEELALALQQHRVAYDSYANQLRSVLDRSRDPLH